MCVSFPTPFDVPGDAEFLFQLQHGMVTMSMDKGLVHSWTGHGQPSQPQGSVYQVFVCLQKICVRQRMLCCWQTIVFRCIAKLCVYGWAEIHRKTCEKNSH